MRSAAIITDRYGAMPRYDFHGAFKTATFARTGIIIPAPEQNHDEPAEHRSTVQIIGKAFRVRRIGRGDLGHSGAGAGESGPGSSGLRRYSHTGGGFRSPGRR